MPRTPAKVSSPNRQRALSPSGGFGKTQLTPDQAKKLDRKAWRMLSAARKVEGESDLAQDAINRIAAAGLGPLSPRRLYDVLNDQGN